MVFQRCRLDALNPMEIYLAGIKLFISMFVELQVKKTIIAYLIYMYVCDEHLTKRFHHSMKPVIVTVMSHAHAFCRYF